MCINGIVVFLTMYPGICITGGGIKGLGLGSGGCGAPIYPGMNG